ncbi:bile acid:sodium symporter family protein [Marinobacter sp. TBZ242]|uniref:Bile acid:sodium symporter family protein n=1 Tax=Marinobacter azerbaijanicus TaxID=3050455 RepID=A0ABT7IIK3_9GAMM|nr:bile acid:sodium symporter family protein [Marinobacter sp. TBZ242]MDL0434005.1 bile acid:sodium symporter family protein [Marinobacter sp. TBZ242]
MRVLKANLDAFTLFLTAVVLVASLLPARGAAASGFELLTMAAIALLFFLHGAKLSRQAIIAGATHWRLHLLIFVFTFGVFPLIGVILRPLLTPMLGESLTLGMLYLCVLPGTVQSAIAFTSLARGNIPAAICSASSSSLIGIFLTPLLLMWNLDTQGARDNFAFIDAVGKISLQLLLPFLAGHLARPLIGTWVASNRHWLTWVDQGSILLVVYTAFSASVVAGLWGNISLSELLTLTLVCCALLAMVLWLTARLARLLRFSREDEVTIVFCASKKSMATGVPMAQVLFPGAALGPMLLPLLVFHQIQLMACAVLARRYREAVADASRDRPGGIEIAR